MTIGRKISLIVGTQVALTAILGVMAFRSASGTNGIVKGLSERSLPMMTTVGKLNGYAKDARGAARNHITLKTAAEKTSADADFVKFRDGLIKEQGNYAELVETPAARAQAQQLATSVRAYTEALNQSVRLSSELKNDEAMELFRSQALPAYKAVQTSLDDITKQTQAAASADAESASSQLHSSQWASGIMLLFSLVVTVFAGVVIQGLNSTLRHGVHALSNAAAQVSRAASESSANSNAIATGASEQAAAVEETSAACHEITAITERNRDRAQESSNLMTLVESEVSNATQAMSEMMASMAEINNSSQRISKIIRVIEEIAFQTNLLALNAAVEAARAGEAGMGFAVVADEVRNLAQRCAQAAKDTTGLIEESIQNASSGTVRVGRVSEAVNSITDTAGKARVIVQEVTHGSGEQAQGVSGISRGVIQIEGVVQRFAAAAEQNAAASTELSQQAETMHQEIAALQALVG